MRFSVPQFIDIEDKVFGPFTIKQFVYMAGGLGLSYIVWRILPHFFAVIVILPLLVICGLLAFYKFNGKPFIFLAEAWVGYLFGSRMYMWKKSVPKEKKEEEKLMEDPSYIPKLSGNKLDELSWSLNVMNNEKKE